MHRSYPYATRFIQFETRRREAREKLLLAEERRVARRGRHALERRERG
jgi:hypothetical protein